MSLRWPKFEHIKFTAYDQPKYLIQRVSDNQKKKKISIDLTHWCHAITFYSCLRFFVFSPILSLFYSIFFLSSHTHNFFSSPLLAQSCVQKWITIACIIFLNSHVLAKAHITQESWKTKNKWKRRKNKKSACVHVCNELNGKKYDVCIRSSILSIQS